MSLEDKIGELTAAVNALAAAMTHPFPALKGAKPWVSEAIPAPEQAKAEVAPPKPAPSTTVPPSDVIEYAAVAKAITDVFKVNRAKVIEVLAKFGATKGPQLEPADYAAFLKELAA